MHLLKCGHQQFLEIWYCQLQLSRCSDCRPTQRLLKTLRRNGNFRKQVCFSCVWYFCRTLRLLQKLIVLCSKTWSKARERRNSLKYRGSRSIFEGWGNRSRHYHEQDELARADGWGADGHAQQGILLIWRPKVKVLIFLVHIKCNGGRIMRIFLDVT